MANPSHMRVVLARDIWIRKDQISGEAQNENEQATRVGKKGEELSILWPVAADLLVQESAVENKAANKGRIEEIRSEATRERDLRNRQESQANQPAKHAKAA